MTRYYVFDSQTGAEHVYVYLTLLDGALEALCVARTTGRPQVVKKVQRDSGKWSKQATVFPDGRAVFEPGCVPGEVAGAVHNVVHRVDPSDLKVEFLALTVAELEAT